MPRARSSFSLPLAASLLAVSLGAEPPTPPGPSLSPAGPPVVWRGRVTDAGNARPVAGARIWPAENPEITATTDPAGRFELVTRGAVSALHAAADGYFPTSRAAPSPGSPVALALIPSASLPGRVVDAAGHAVAGARVQAGRDGEDTEPRDLQATSGFDGRFRLDGLVPRGSYEILATAPGLAPAHTIAPAPEAGDTAPPVLLVLTAGRGAAGRVVDLRGRALAGAHVVLRRSSLGRHFAGLAPGTALDDGLFEAETGGDGRFLLPSLPPGRFDLTVTASGFSPFRRQGLEVAEGAGPADFGRLLLERGVAAHGRVTDTAGRPLAGVEVWLVPRGIDDWGAYYARGPAARSDREGRFVLSDLPAAGELGLDLCHAGFLPTSETWPEPPAAPVTLTLETAGRLEGRVLGPDGAPVAGAQVEARPRRGVSPPENLRPCWRERLHGTTAADGTFVLDGLPAGTWRVGVRAPGLLGSESPPRRLATGEAVAGLEIRLSAGAVITGRVLDADGLPAARTVVASDGRADRPQTETDGSGSYRLEGVETGPRSVSARRGEEQAERTVAAVPGENRLDLVLAPLSSQEVRGAVLGPEGGPVPGARVFFGTGESSPTAADGTFRLRVPDGTYRPWAEKEGYAPGLLAEPFVVDGAAVAGIEIRLARGAVITGRVLGLPPEELAGTTVSLEAPPFQYRVAVGADGGFRMADVLPGAWKVIVQAGHRSAAAWVEIPDGETEADVTIELAPTHEVAGRVLDPYGAPVTGARVRVFGPNARGIGTTTRADGTFLFRLEDGRYRLWATRDGFYRAVLHDFVEVEGGPVSGLDLSLLPGIALSGRIAGLPPEETAHTVYAEGPSTRLGEVDERGDYRIPDLGPGEWRVFATLGPRVAEGRVTLEEGMEEALLDLEFPPEAPEAPSGPHSPGR